MLFVSSSRWPDALQLSICIKLVLRTRENKNGYSFEYIASMNRHQILNTQIRLYRQDALRISFRNKHI